MISERDRQVLGGLPSWKPAGDIAAQRRAWEELAVVYNHDLPAIGALEENVELRSGRRADVAVPKDAGPHPVVIYLHGGGWRSAPLLPSYAPASRWRQSRREAAFDASFLIRLVHQAPLSAEAERAFTLLPSTRSTDGLRIT
jgi:acetyl esterase/lipase